MKKEYFWFLIFILAAAVITGSTLGMITNFKYISQQTKVLLQEQENNETKNTQTQSNTQTKQNSAASETSSNNTADHNTGNSVTISVGTADSKAEIPVSNVEKTEIEAMLNSVASSGSDFKAQVIQFQKANSLPSTGTMDTQTLQTLINQVTIQRAVQRLNS